ncbi:hypothetical protein ROZALSC1DRAFT_30959, partial [Rozella allomycis CSF55]
MDILKTKAVKVMIIECPRMKMWMTGLLNVVAGVANAPEPELDYQEAGEQLKETTKIPSLEKAKNFLKNLNIEEFASMTTKVIKMIRKFTITFRAITLLVLFWLYKRMKSKQLLIVLLAEPAGDFTVISNKPVKIIGNEDNRVHIRQIVLESEPKVAS